MCATWSCANLFLIAHAYTPYGHGPSCPSYPRSEPPWPRVTRILPWKGIFNSSMHFTRLPRRLSYLGVWFWTPSPALVINIVHNTHGVGVAREICQQDGQQPSSPLRCPDQGKGCSHHGRLTVWDRVRFYQGHRELATFSIDPCGPQCRQGSRDCPSPRGRKPRLACEGAYSRARSLLPRCCSGCRRHGQ